jgi:hypothetical protein
MPPTNKPPARYIRAQQVDIMFEAEPGPSGSVGVGTSRCGNVACPSGCPAVVLALTLRGQWVKLIFPPHLAREIAFDLLAAADTNDPAGAATRRAS